MLIHWDGNGVRVVGVHEWTPANGHTQDVSDADLVANLLTQPGESFTVDERDPLAARCGAARAGELALQGILTVDAAEIFGALAQPTSEANDE